MRLFKTSIIRKIFFVAGSLIILIFIIYASFFNLKNKQYFEQTNKDSLLKDAKQIATEVQLFMNNYQIIVEQMQKSPDFATIASRLNDRTAKFTDPLYPKINNRLQQIRQNDNNIALVYIGVLKSNDLITNIYEYAPPADYVLSERNWYKQSKNLNRATITSPYIDIVTKKVVLTISIPLLKDGIQVGVAGLDLMLDDIYKIMSNYKIGDKGYAVLLRKDGSIIYHPQYDFSQNWNEVNISDLLEKNSSTILSGKSGLIEYTYQGEDKYLAYLPIENSDLIVAAIIPESQVYAPLKSFLFTNILVLFLVLILISILLYYLEKTIAKPIVSISNTLENFTQNNLSITLPNELLLRQDEIGNLTRSLNFMSQKISNHVLEIDERNLALSEEISIRTMIQIRLEMILKLLSGTREAIFILDESYTCLYKNNAFEELNITPKDDFDKVNIIDKILSSKAHLLQELLKTGQIVKEVSFQNNNGIIICLFDRL